MDPSIASASYDITGAGYDRTRRADPYIARRLAWHLGIQQQQNYLDLGCGTGNYTLALAGVGGIWHGLDQSQRMLHTAHGKLNDISWCAADAAALPYPAGLFSGVVCVLAIHHFTDLAAMFSEVHRVVASGRMVIFTSTPEQMSGFWLREYFPIAMERAIDQMPSLYRVRSGLLQAGFRLVCCEPYSVHPGLRDLFLYCGKYAPQLYLSPDIRRGISTFATLADPTEMAAGCGQLRRHIASGHIRSIMSRYEHERGDYMFVTAERPAVR